MNSGERQPEGDHEPGQERWLVSYADFMTLMFAFFAVLYATSEKDMSKSKEFQESIKRYLIKAGAFGDSGQQIQQGDKNNSPIEPPIQTFKDSRPETVAALDQAEAFVLARLTPEERKKYVLDLSADEWGVRVILPSQALFSNGSDKFREDALPFIAKLGQLLVDSKRKVLIEGHVASGERGGTRSTWDFASARALNLLRYLEKSRGMPGAQLAAVSLADSRPAFQGAQAPLNSRLEVILLNSDMNF
ncbi:MAG TPA: flagellar motor protein MotB [Bdellovibrionales bacterium]|nr:flagellar motor protein MotB [Bdellovibrionales bacterium]